MRLRDAIWRHAEINGGKANPFDGSVDAKLWRFREGGMYSLMPGVNPGLGRDVMVYEPSTAGGRRFVILSDGSIQDRDEGVLAREIQAMIRK